MDPDALWKMIVGNLRALHADHHDRDERENAIDNLRYLIDWLKDGGFPPNVDTE